MGELTDNRLCYDDINFQFVYRYLRQEITFYSINAQLVLIMCILFTFKAFIIGTIYLPYTTLVTTNGKKLIKSNRI